MSLRRQGTKPVDPEANTTVALEYSSLRHRSHCPLGMYIVPSAESITCWDGVFFCHQGYYADAVLKFRLNFPADYPEHPPSVQFITEVFHPLIAADGTFNLSPRFRPWRPKEHHVFDILHWIKAAFKKKALDGLKDFDCLNKEAYKLYHDSTQTFANLATQSTQLSQTTPSLFHATPGLKPSFALQFRQLKPEQVHDLRAKLGFHQEAQEKVA